jgi:RNA polymerase sigma factor (sigma-70 family)
MPTEQPRVSRDKDAIYEELLALRCRRGDPAALEELVRAWEKRLLYFIRRLVKNEQDAWDILQQTWLRVLPGIRALKDPQRLTPWLYQVARNTAFNHARLQAVYRAGLEEHADADLPDEDAAVVEFDHAEEVHAALEQLSLPHREVLTLYFLEDLTIAEIAGVIGVQPGTVKSRLFYARRALRDILQKESARHE